MRYCKAILFTLTHLALPKRIGKNSQRFSDSKVQRLSAYEVVDHFDEHTRKLLQAPAASHVAPAPAPVSFVQHGKKDSGSIVCNLFCSQHYSPRCH